MNVQLLNISKSFSGNPVLDNVSLEVKEGQIHALVGENGAGKSTLMKILTGVEKADSGTILINGKPRDWADPLQARHAGIAMVYQELSLVSSLTVFENIFLGRLIRKNAILVDWHEMKERVAAIFRDIDFEIDMDKLVEELSIAEKQIVEIARALAQNAELIILDEPTSPLSTKEAQRLFQRMKVLKEKGVSFIYITHRLEEIFEVADFITILRDGRRVTSCPVSSVDIDSVIHDMVGRELQEQFPPKRSAPRDVQQIPALKVENATREGEFYDVNLSVYYGEILGIAGLVGAGRTELVEAIFGVTTLHAGIIHSNGRMMRIASPKSAVNSGVGLIADDRKVKGLVTDAAVEFNLIMSTQDKFASPLGWRRKRQERVASQKLVEQLNIKLHSLQQSIEHLSGGNQQKVAIGKTLNTDSLVLIFDEPTRGIDVGAKRDIYFLIRELADNGAAVILVSSEMEEILGLCDRIVVMHNGRITGELDGNVATQEKIMQLAVGLEHSTEVN